MDDLLDFGTFDWRRERKLFGPLNRRQHRSVLHHYVRRKNADTASDRERRDSAIHVSGRTQCARVGMQQRSSGTRCVREGSR